MSNRNWQQQFVTNPASAAQNNDLFYLARAPYLTDGTDDFVINWQNFLASIQAQIQGGYKWQSVSGAPTVAMATNNGYITIDNANLATFHLPPTPVIGDSVKIDGFSTAGWTIPMNGGTQKIHILNGNVTAGTGSLSSSSTHDSITLRAVDTNNWIAEIYATPGFVTT